MKYIYLCNQMVQILLYSAYISQVFNFVSFVNFELFVKFIELKFEQLLCQAHGQHASTIFFNKLLQNSYS